ncbi:MAG: CYTH domain-containing protein, partial [Candidatus Limnocylindrales bacterium]
MSEPLEIEIKFAVSRPDLVRAMIDDPDPAHLAGFVADGEVHVAVMTDRYLDTEVGGALFRNGMRARLRVAASGVVLAVKRKGVVSAGGVTTRVELQGPATAAMEPARWPESDAKAVLIETVDGMPLVEIAALRQVRHTRLLRRGDALVEVSLDRMTALAGDHALAQRVELEAELK